MTAKEICAGIGALALIGGLAACGNSSGDGSGGGSAAPLSVGAWYNTIGLPEINTVNQDIEMVANDRDYDIDPMNDEEQAVTDAQAGLVNLPPVDAADWTGWLKDVILTEQAVEASGFPNPEVEITSQQYSQAFAAAVAAATGSAGAGSGEPGTPAAAPANTQVTDPAGNTCSSLDSAGYCPGDDPATQAAAPAPSDTAAASAPATQAAPAPVSSALLEESWFNAIGKAELASIQNDLAAIHNGVATSNAGQSLKTDALAMVDSYNNLPPPIDPSDYSAAIASWAAAGQDITIENNPTDAATATPADVATLLSQATTYINNWNATVSAADAG